MDGASTSNELSSSDQTKADGTSKDTDSITSDQIVKTEEEDLDSETEHVKSNDETKKQQSPESSQRKTLETTEENASSESNQSPEIAQTTNLGNTDEKTVNKGDQSPKSAKTKTVETVNENETGESTVGINGSDTRGVIQTKNIQPRSILKTTSSEPAIIVTPPPRPPQHSASSDDFRGKRGKKNHLNYLNDSQTVQEFVNPAFELDENVPNEFRLADIVEQVLQQEIYKYQHPFGKGNLYNTVFLGEKSSAHTGGGRLILWFIFAFALVGMAGVIIFMSEIYKTDIRDGRNLTSL